MLQILTEWKGQILNITHLFRSFSPRPGPSTHNSMVDSDEDEEEDRDSHSPLPTKRVRVSDINITRFVV